MDEGAASVLDGRQVVQANEEAMRASEICSYDRRQSCNGTGFSKNL